MLRSAILLVFLISGFSVFGQCNLQAHFRLDGNARDSSSFANHATVYGAVPTNDRFNQPNGAMYFDGINDYINTFTTYDFQERTVSFWFKSERLTGPNAVLIQDANTLTYGAFSTRVLNGDMRGRAGQTSGTLMYSNVNLNQWYHVTLVRRTDSAIYYINGVKSFGVISGVGGSLTSPYEKLVIGAGRQRNINFFKGSIDDIKIFDCAFTAVQVDSLYSAQTPFPPLTALSLDTTLCLGDSLIFDLDGGSNISYLWDNGCSDTLRKISNSGVYTLRQTRAGDTLIDTMRVNFTSPYIPTSLDTSFCLGGSIYVDYSALSVDSLVWFDGSTSRQRTFNTVGTFDFTVYQAHCGITLDSLRISLDSVLSPITWDTSSCRVPLLIGGRSESYLNYRWSTGQNSSHIEVFESGTYTVRVRGACSSVTDTFRVTLPISIPTQSPADTLFICSSKDSVQIGISINSALSFNWSNNASNTLQWLDAAGDYSLFVFNECDTIENKYTVLYDSILIPEPLPDTLLCEYNKLNFDFNYDGVKDVAVNGKILFNNTLSIREAGTYIVEYLQECGSAVDTFAVDMISCECDFIIPNAFTPNGDGLNDRFRIENQCEDLNHTIQIFNSWGTLVFENETNTDFWNGTHNGNHVSGGVYIYKLNYSGHINGKHYQGFKKGFVTVIR
tara:strand:+ start:6707 stop:8719 length:2013 start_codon:yes stop_codon:yes gene_type:complete